MKREGRFESRPGGPGRAPRRLGKAPLLKGRDHQGAEVSVRFTKISKSKPVDRPGSLPTDRERQQIPGQERRGRSGQGRLQGRPALIPGPGQAQGVAELEEGYPRQQRKAWGLILLKGQKAPKHQRKDRAGGVANFLVGEI